VKHYFPHILHGFQDKAPPLVCACVRRWPTLQAAHLARRTPLEACCRAHHGRSAAVIAPRIPASKRATPLTTDEGGIAPHALVVPALVAHLRVTVPAIADVDTASAPRAQSPPDCPLLQALPGAGPVFAPRLLGAFGAQRTRYATAAALQK
jgi:hypothetical protein